MRHIETVRNFLNVCIRELIERQEQHDQSKLQEPELSICNEYTPKLKNIIYGSEEYKKCLDEIKPFVAHHYKHNRHHVEFFDKGINDMNLIDLLEMICDWYAATLRQKGGNIYNSLELNSKKYIYSEQLYDILKNTIRWLEHKEVYHNAQES